MLDFKISRREQTSLWIDLGIPVASFLIALLVSAVLLLIQGVQPIEAYRVLFITPIEDRFGITQLVNVSSILILASLAVYIPLKANLYNVGSEGQLYIGAIFAVWIGLSVDIHSWALIVLMMLAGMVGGGIYGLIPGYLRAKYGINEILVTLLSIFIAYGINRYVVLGPLARERGGFPGSDQLPQAGVLPEIGGPHIGIILAAIAVIMTHVFFTRTTLGYKSVMYGSNPTVAKQSGISEYKIILIIMGFGSLLAGLAGMILVSGEIGRLRLTLGPEYGIIAIAVAFLGRNGVPQVVFSALLFSFLLVGGRFLESSLAVPISLINIIQATVVIVIVSGEFLKTRKVTIDIDVTERGV